jgi:hypothetical protein
MTYFLQRAGFWTVPLETYTCAEAAVEAVLAQAPKCEKWKIAAGDISSFEVVLMLHDEQLAIAPMQRVVEAEKRLRAFVTGTTSSQIIRRDD